MLEESLQPQIPFSELFDLILKIDFQQQVQLVKETVELHYVAGFLVQGEPESGQQILVNRLLRLIPNWKNSTLIKIDLSSRVVRKSTSNLWRQFALWCGLSRDAEPSQVLDKICERWQTQNINLIIEKVDYMPPQFILEWLKEFWEPLVAMAQKRKSRCNTYLLMFLVDYSGSVDLSNLLLQPDQPEFPSTPLRLPPTSQFSQNILDSWIAMASQNGKFPAEVTSKMLLDRTDNGIPELIYEEICNQVGCSWEGDLARWLI